MSDSTTPYEVGVIERTIATAADAAFDALNISTVYPADGEADLVKEELVEALNGLRRITGDSQVALDGDRIVYEDTITSMGGRQLKGLVERAQGIK